MCCSRFLKLDPDTGTSFQVEETAHHQQLTPGDATSTSSQAGTSGSFQLSSRNELGTCGLSLSRVGAGNRSQAGCLTPLKKLVAGSPVARVHW